MVEDLLKIDFRFMSPEPHVDDLSYTARVIVVCNAAKLNPNIIPLLPKYIFRHVHYLGDKYPSYLPPFDFFGIFAEMLLFKD